MKALPTCAAGHEPPHVSRLVSSNGGDFWVWNWRQYGGSEGYCPANDVVSEVIDTYGFWEPAETARMLELLVAEPGTVVDFGAHLGWYAIQAAAVGCDVLAVDADPENVRLLLSNVEQRDVGDHVRVYNSYAADLTYTVELPDRIRFLKSDVEGAEDDVVAWTRPLFAARLVDHALLEVSPVFADYYPALLTELVGYGYDAWIDASEKGGGRIDVDPAEIRFSQANVWLDRLD